MKSEARPALESRNEAFTFRSAARNGKNPEHKNKTPEKNELLEPILSFFSLSVARGDALTSKSKHTIETEYAGENQDSYYASARRGLFVVADGVGGNVAGKEASTIVTNEFSSMPDMSGRSVADTKRMIAETLVMSRFRISEAEKADPETAGMATTAVVAQVVGNKLVYGNAGDSALFVYREDKQGGQELIQLTTEQCIAGNVVTNYISSKIPEARSERSDYTDDEIGVFDLIDGDRLVLVSDGILGDRAEDRVDESVFKSVLSKERSADEAAHELLWASKKKDDTTVIVVDYDLLKDDGFEHNKVAEDPSYQNENDGVINNELDRYFAKRNDENLNVRDKLLFEIENELRNKSPEEIAQFIASQKGNASVVYGAETLLLDKMVALDADDTYTNKIWNIAYGNTPHEEDIATNASKLAAEFDQLSKEQKLAAAAALNNIIAEIDSGEPSKTLDLSTLPPPRAEDIRGVKEPIELAQYYGETLDLDDLTGQESKQANGINALDASLFIDNSKSPRAKVGSLMSRARNRAENLIVHGPKDLMARLHRAQSNDRLDQGERSKRRNKVLVGIGVAAVALGAALIAKKVGIDMIPGLDGDGTDLTPWNNYTPEAMVPNVNANEHMGHLDAVPPKRSLPIDVPPTFSAEAQTINAGEGWYQTMSEMNIPTDTQPAILQEVGPKLQELGTAYFDNGAGEYRMKLGSGQLSQDALNVIAEAARNRGITIG